MSHFLRIILCWLIAIAFLISACSDDSERNNTLACDNCKGCCDNGQCVAFTEQDENSCGKNSKACAPCNNNQTCNQGVCESSGSTSCDPNSCNGCCSNNSCIELDDQDSTTGCGTGGNTCLPCSGTCNQGGCSTSTTKQDLGTSKKPDATTTVKCSGCTTGCCSSTGHCMEGTSDYYCGEKGATCENCFKADKKCVSHKCDCVPICNQGVGKCIGESDGCGGQCQTNTCKGCCSSMTSITGSKTCVSGNTDSYCGQGGGNCAECKKAGKKCDTTIYQCK